MARDTMLDLTIRMDTSRAARQELEIRLVLDNWGAICLLKSVVVD